MRIGDVLSGRFRIETELSRSADGIVFGAHDLVLDRKVAIRPVATEHATVFRTTQVDRVFEVVTDGASSYAVMEYPRLRRRAKRGARRRPFLLGFGFAVLAVAFVGVGVYERSRGVHELLPAKLDLAIVVAEAAPPPAPEVAPVPSAATKPARRTVHATRSVFAGHTTSLTYDRAHEWYVAHEGELAECIEESRCQRGANVALGWQGNFTDVDAADARCETGNFVQCVVNMVRRNARSWPTVECEIDASTCNSLIRVRLE